MIVVRQMVYRDAEWMGSLKVDQIPDEYEPILMETFETNDPSKHTRMVRLLSNITVFTLSPPDSVGEDIMFSVCRSAAFVRSSGQVLLTTISHEHLEQSQCNLWEITISSY